MYDQLTIQIWIIKIKLPSLIKVRKIKMKSTILKRFMQTQASQSEKHTQNTRNTKNQSMYNYSNYNVKDFLPSASNHNTKSISFIKNKSLQRKVNTCNQELLSQNQTSKFPMSQTQLDGKESIIVNAVNVDSDENISKLNLVLEENNKLKLQLAEQTSKNQQKSKDIQTLKNQIMRIKFKNENVRLWSNKISIDIMPIKKHSYEISMQTENIIEQKQKKSKTLKAKDFEQLYRKFNINSNNPSRAFQKNNANKLSNNYSCVGGLTSKNTSYQYQKNPKSKTNINLNINNEQSQKNMLKNDSLFKPIRNKNVIPDFESFLNENKNKNKENKRNWDNIGLDLGICHSQNEMDTTEQNNNFDFMEMQKNRQNSFKLPSKDITIEVYPIDDDQLQGVISQLMEKQLD